MGAPKGKPSWNAGTSQGWVDKRGYHWIYVTENGKRRAKRKHRDVMEKHLGRKLSPEEAVHHKDGNPSNNDINNLEIVSFADHQREHHVNSKRPDQTRRTMEIMANYREEHKHLKFVNAELLEALEKGIAGGWLRQELYDNAIAAIKKAKGEL